MKKNNMFTAENVDTLLEELYNDIISSVGGISTIRIDSMFHPNQDARLISVKGKDMVDFKSAGGAFLGKEGNPNYVDLPCGEYVHFDEFYSAIENYFQKKENRKKVFFVESEEWKRKRRKVDTKKLKELKKLSTTAAKLSLEANTKVTNQDSRIISANVPGDSLDYSKKIGGMFLGSEKNNVKKGLPEHLLPQDNSEYISKDQLIKQLEIIFKAYRNLIPFALPLISVTQPAVAETMVETRSTTPIIQEQEVEQYSESIVIGDVVKLPAGTKFYEDSWLNPGVGSIGNKYATTEYNTVNSINVIDNETGKYYQCSEKGKSLEQFVSELQSEGKLSDNYSVRYHIGEGVEFTEVGGNNDLGWLDYDAENYPVDKRYPIGKTTERVVKGTRFEHNYVRYTTNIENVNKEYDKITMVDGDGNIMVLYSKDGSSFKLKDGIELIDKNGRTYKCEVEKSDKEVTLKAIIPFVIPYEKKIKKDEEDDDKDIDGDDKDSDGDITLNDGVGGVRL